VKERIAIIGAGIVGLAHARAAAMRGHAVTVYERHAMATGASVRNFGLCLLLGQPQGELHDMALHTRAVWLEMLAACGAWHKAKGSLAVARDAVEWDVLRAFHALHGASYDTQLLDTDALKTHNVHGVGGLFSSREISLEARVALPLLAQWLAEQYGVRFEYGTQVNAIDLPRLHTSRGVREADRVFVCAGHDVQALYAEQMASLGVRQCALQMLRVASFEVAPEVAYGPAILTGLSALHYPSFSQSPDMLPLLDKLRQQVQREEAHLLEHGIHLLVQQVANGELIIGDSHHYADTSSPFTREEVDAAILHLAEDVLQRPLQVRERWQGIYASGPNPYEVFTPDEGITAVVVTAGIGMSIAFGLAEQVLDRRFTSSTSARNPSP
jgi:FAD dependent oxidoreductase TIGR03364